MLSLNSFIQLLRIKADLQLAILDYFDHGAYPPCWCCNRFNDVLLAQLLQFLLHRFSESDWISPWRILDGRRWFVGSDVILASHSLVLSPKTAGYFSGSASRVNGSGLFRDVRRKCLRVEIHGSLADDVVIEVLDDFHLDASLAYKQWTSCFFVGPACSPGVIPVVLEYYLSNNGKLRSSECNQSMVCEWAWR